MSEHTHTSHTHAHKHTLSHSHTLSHTHTHTTLPHTQASKRFQVAICVTVSLWMVLHSKKRSVTLALRCSPRVMPTLKFYCSTLNWSSRVKRKMQRYAAMGKQQGQQKKDGAGGGWCCCKTVHNSFHSLEHSACIATCTHTHTHTHKQTNTNKQTHTHTDST